MPAPAMYGLGSGQDHSKTIQKLLKLERIPIKRMKRNSRRNQIRIKAWKQTRTRARKLAERSRRLYSFLGPFAHKGVVSSDPGAITGKANASVEPGKHYIEVVQLATRQQLHSKRVGTEATLAKGKFSIGVGKNKHTYDFKGGKLSELERLIRKQGKADFEVFRVRVDSSRAMIGLRSKHTGLAGALKFTDPDGLLRSIGLIKPGKSEDKVTPVVLKKEQVKVYNRKGLRPDNMSWKVLSGGKSLFLKGQGAVKTPGKLDPGSQIEFEVQLQMPGKKGPKRRMQTVRPGPKISVNVGKIRLHGYNITRSRETTDPIPQGKLDGAPAGIGLMWTTKDGKEMMREVLLQKSGKQTLDVKKLTGGNAVSGLYFFARSGTQATFSGLKGVIPGDATSGFEPVKETTKPQDAKLKLHGVEITRSKNKGLSDVIDGVNLNFNRTTKGAVTVTIKAESDKIIKEIKEWVQAYNSLLKYCRDNSKAGASTELSRSRSGKDLYESMRRARRNSGIFAADATVRRLMYALRGATARSYPGDGPTQFRVLSDIGISTGAVGFKSFAGNKEGYLKIDEAKLRQAIQTSPEAVKRLFASDTNSDARIDNGAAFEMGRLMKPYAQFSGGLIAIRIQLLKTRIAETKRRIEAKELSIKATEARLKRRFARMEIHVRRNRATGNYLRGRMGGGGGRR